MTGSLFLYQFSLGAVYASEYFLYFFNSNTVMQ